MVSLNKKPLAVELSTTTTAVPEVYEPKYTEYTTKASRYMTYEKWPKNAKQSPADLVAAGFFYTGIGDRVQCFYCGIGLNNWRDYHVAWEQHALWMKKCPFMRMLKGEGYAQEINDKLKNVGNTPIDVAKICKICYNNEPDVVYMPCSHVLACRFCAVQSANCPYCGIKYEKVVRIYFP